jgi:hypothetical protein
MRAIVSIRRIQKMRVWSSEKNFIDSKSNQMPSQVASIYGERKAITPQGGPKQKKEKKGLMADVPKTFCQG